MTNNTTVVYLSLADKENENVKQISDFESTKKQKRCNEHKIKLSRPLNHCLHFSDFQRFK